MALSKLFQRIELPRGSQFIVRHFFPFLVLRRDALSSIGLHRVNPLAKIERGC